MKRILRINLIVYVVFVLGMMTVTAQESEQDLKNIVIFHSYHSDLDWTNDLQQGIADTIDSKNIEIYVEYMDSYRTSSEDYDEILFEYFKNRYEHIKMDVVVVADNYAFDFMSKYYTQLFDGVPMVFGGVNDFSTEDIFYKDSTGLAQTSSQEETIELIIRLHPDVSRIVALGGRNATSMTETAAIIAVGDSVYPEIEFVQVISDNLEEQVHSLSEYGEETAVIIAGAMRNERGQFYNHSQYSGAIIDRTGLPVYAMASVYIRTNGAIGGYVVDAQEHGAQMGDYVNRILEGEPINTLPIIEQPPAKYQFDFSRLKEFNIEPAMLPMDKEIVNLPDRNMSVDKMYIMIYASVAFLLVLIIVVMMINIKKRKEAEEELNKHNDILQHMAFHDSATNLFNRKYMVDYLQKHLVEQNHYFTAFYDVDITNLKMLNDTYGHEIGSKVQKHIASVLKKTFRSENECVGVYQSEFLIVDSEVNSCELAIKKAQHIISLISKAIEIDYMEIDIRVNVGVAVAPDHTMDASQLMKKANIALVEAMKMGPSIAKIFEDTLYRDVLKRITLEKQLRRAISLEEFELYYQPKVDIKTMQVNGCEALIRWNHPDGKIVYPGDFIPLAEEVGLIEDIGRWVVHQSASQVKAWNDIGHEIKVSLNVSGREFDDEFIRNLKHVIEDIEVDPRLLEVEITETAALKDIEHSRALVQMLYNLGLTVSLDDFGTGYSSMTYIKQLKASKLKIDKSFIDDLGNYEQKVVVDSMIQLGKKLDYLINVEGVETEEQLRILKYLGVDEVQGWYFSKAVPAKAFIEFAEAFKKKHS